MLPCMAGSSHAFQAPRGTRDFHPDEMAVRLHIEQAWRTASINHGFDEIEGPTFEHLELYTSKSGPGIVSELFSFRRSGGETDFALRPEFTPTLARMAAALGRGLPVPTRWFSMPMHYRAERPQRGRLREFRQWNIDVIGIDGPDGDAETIAVALAALQALGLDASGIRVKISHRAVVSRLLTDLGVSSEHMADAQDLLDKRDRIKADAFSEKAAALGLTPQAIERFAAMGTEAIPASTDPSTLAEQFDVPSDAMAELAELRHELELRGVLDFCEWDFSIVRGLAYYTGTVWEIHEASGSERAIAGGGRYDTLIESYGGPSVSACGFGMGDVVLELVLRDRQLISDASALMPRPDAFVISIGGDDTNHAVVPLLARLRGAGLHARTSSKTTSNLGKLLKDAGKCNAKHAVILGDELADGNVVVKDFDAGEQTTVSVDDLLGHLTGSADS
jgi:histidyl-tRNA synthetase